MNVKKGGIIVLAITAVIAVIFIIAAMVTPTEASLVYPGGEFSVKVADSAIEQKQGLSGTELATFDADGMLFVFNDFKERTFWMNGMNYDLDIVWIRNGKVVKIETDVPAPKAGEEPARMYSRPFEVDMVLELPAGTAIKEGLVEGHEVSLKGWKGE